VVHAGSGSQTVYIKSVRRKGKTTTMPRGTRRKESTRVDTDPLLRGWPGLAGPELGLSRTPAASVLRNDACLRLPARNSGVVINIAQIHQSMGRIIGNMSNEFFLENSLQTVV
jgi:hypothetical protein